MTTNMVPISEARVKLAELVRTADEGVDVVLMRHGHPAALIISVARMDALLEEIEDLQDRLSVFEAREHPDVVVGWDHAVAELGLEAGDGAFTGKLDA